MSWLSYSHDASYNTNLHNANVQFQVDDIDTNYMSILHFHNSLFDQDLPAILLQNSLYRLSQTCWFGSIRISWWVDNSMLFPRFSCQQENCKCHQESATNAKFGLKKAMNCRGRPHVWVRVITSLVKNVFWILSCGCFGVKSTNSKFLANLVW